MDKDKIKQFVALIGGFLGALYLALTFYGVYKNTFIITDKAKKQ